MVLSGHGVRLEPLEPRHAPALLAIAAGDRESFRFTFVPDGTAEDVARYVAAAHAAWERGDTLAYAIVTDGRVVGSTRLGNAERWDWPGGKPRPSVIDGVEIGWTWIAPDFQRSHVNTAAKLLLLRHAFETLGVHRVTLITDVRNARSRAAIERLGAKLDGVLRAHFPSGDGTIRDTATYSILAQEWPDLRARIDARLAPVTR